MKKIILTAASLFVLAACCANSDETATSKQSMVGGKGNPASVNCIEKGGKLSFVTQANVGTSGMCTFPNGKTCEDWALFRGECSAK